MGPLHGIKVIELVGLGPGPFCGMLLSDMGADVISIERLGVSSRDDVVCMRGRRPLGLNLKSSEGVEVLLDLCDSADVLFEGFRPGVAERLGVGPEVCMGRNPKLIYGRMTGWGQDGPLAQTAGHDINYISLSGALHAIGREGQAPLPPLNLAGDYGGGGMLLAFGILSALLERHQSGQGQVVDASMVDGSALLMSVFYGMYANGQHTTQRGTNVLDTGAPYYEVYETKTEESEESQFVSLGPLEPQFYDLLIECIGADKNDFYPQDDRSQWAQRKEILKTIFIGKTRDEWQQLLGGTDTCFAPVLSIAEAATHPHNIARSTFVDIDGVVQPAPAPRFSRTQPDTPFSAPDVGACTERLLKELNYSEEKISKLQAAGVVG